MSEQNRPIRILQVFSSLNMGGAESRMMDVYRTVDRTRCAFTFLSMTEGEQYYEEEIRALGGEVIKIRPPRESGSLSNFRTIRRILKEGKFDAVHAHTSFHCGIVMLAGKCAGVPIRIAHSRTTGSKNHSIKNKIALWFGRGLISLFSTKRLAISDEAGKYLFGKKSFSVLPNAIDCEKYLSTEEAAAQRLRETYKIPRENRCFGLVGRFCSMKNHAFAVDLFRAYHEKHPQSTLIFVGDGMLRREIEEKVRSSGLDDSVVFTGIQSNVNEWMRLFDLLLVPSLFEGLGGVILEAQAAGTPVLKSDSFTDEADMKIGLVRSLSLEAGNDVWIDAMEAALRIPAPDADTIRAAFDRKGYSLSSEIKVLQSVYEGGVV